MLLSFARWAGDAGLKTGAPFTATGRRSWCSAPFDRPAAPGHIVRGWPPPEAGARPRLRSTHQGDFDDAKGNPIRPVSDPRFRARPARLWSARDGGPDGPRNRGARGPRRRRHRDRPGPLAGSRGTAAGLPVHRRQRGRTHDESPALDPAAQHLELRRGHPRVRPDGQGLLRPARLPALPGLRDPDDRVGTARQPGGLRELQLRRRNAPCSSTGCTTPCRSPSPRPGCSPRSTASSPSSAPSRR